MRPINSLLVISLAALGLATTTGSMSAQELVGEGEKAGTKIVVRGLKRDEGGTVTLRFQLINDGEKPLKTYGVWASTTPWITSICSMRPTRRNI
jgi:hypothetical protein